MIASIAPAIRAGGQDDEAIRLLLDIYDEPVEDVRNRLGEPSAWLPPEREEAADGAEEAASVVRGGD